MGSIKDLWLEAGASALKLMIDGGVRVFQATRVAQTVVRVPWGWLVAEKALNGEDVKGIRWPLMSQPMAAGFKELPMLLTPSNHAQMKQNHTQAMLGNVLLAFGKLAVASGSCSPSAVEVKLESANFRALVACVAAISNGRRHYQHSNDNFTLLLRLIIDGSKHQKYIGNQMHN